MIKRKKRLFYTSICNFKSIFKKLNCIRDRTVNIITPYKEPYKDIIIKPIYKDIYEYNEFYKSLLKLDLNKKILIEPVEFDKLVDIELSIFFTNNYKMIDNIDNVWIEFIDNIILIYEWYDNNYKKVNNPILYRNSMLIKPYLDNSLDIVDNILNIINLERRYK